MINVPRLGNAAHIINNTLDTTWSPRDKIVILYSDEKYYFAFNGYAILKFELLPAEKNPFFPYLGDKMKNWIFGQRYNVKYIDKKWCSYEQEEYFNGNFNITKNILYFSSLEEIVLFLLV